MNNPTVVHGLTRPGLYGNGMMNAAVKIAVTTRPDASLAQAGFRLLQVAMNDQDKPGGQDACVWNYYVSGNSAVASGTSDIVDGSNRPGVWCMAFAPHR